VEFALQLSSGGGAVGTPMSVGIDATPGCGSD
jgi:hypothetical protein